MRIIALFVIGMVMAIGLGLLFPGQLAAQEPLMANNAETIEAVRQVIYAELIREGDAAQATVGAEVVIAGNYAMGSWGLGEMGGVTIVERRSDGWYVLCSTGGVYSSNEMQQFCNVPANAATSLEQQWQQISN